MVRNKHAVKIARPRVVVFSYLTEPDHLVRWVSGLEAFEPLNGEAARVGSRSRQRMLIRGREWDFKGEILELEAPKRLVVRINGRGLRMTSTYVLRRTAEGTRLVVTVESDVARLLARFLDGIVEREGQRKLKADLNRLADLVESETGES